MRDGGPDYGALAIGLTLPRTVLAEATEFCQGVGRVARPGDAVDVLVNEAVAIGGLAEPTRARTGGHHGG